MPLQPTSPTHAIARTPSRGRSARVGVLVAAAAVALGARSTALPTDGVPAYGSAAWHAAELQLARPASGLAAGVQAAREGRAALAAWLFGETALRHPVIGDHAELLRAQELLAADRRRESVAVLEQAIDAYPRSPLVADFAAALGDARLRLGDEEGARRAWRRALDASSDSSLRASLLSATARSQERSGDAAGAAETWTVVWYHYPISAEAAYASRRLDRLEPSVGTLRDAASWRKRADRLFRLRRNEAALDAYDRALALGLSPSEADRVHHRRAQTLFRMRDYPRAVEAFGALRQVDDIPIWHARSLARAGRVPEAIREFERLARQRRGQLALRARFLAALLLDGRDRFDEARRHFESLTRGGDRSAVRRAALWRLAWGAYREERHVEAIGLLDQLIEVTSDPIDNLRSRYWRARSLEALAAQGPADEAGAAMREFAAIANEYPLSYYGWRARARLPEKRRAALAADLHAADARASRWADGGPRKLSARDIERARILLEAGLDDRALDELERARGSVGGLSDRLELAQQFRNAGSFHEAQRLVLDRYSTALARGPTPTYEDLWWHAWPAAFIDVVREVTAGEGSVEPALVLSIMREESGFQPRVVSPVGARGLLQIMEPTGRRLAAAVGQAGFTADDLFDPRTNIRLGAYYLAELSHRFDGRLSAAIASYNAGPEAVGSWLEKDAAVDDDVWVESIPYDQTRLYVKRVLRSLQAYQLLY